MSERVLLLALLLAGCNPLVSGETRIAQCCEWYDAGGYEDCVPKLRSYHVSPAADLVTNDHHVCAQNGWVAR